MHIAGTSFCQLEISSKTFQSHFDFSPTLSKAINSNTIVDLAMQVCLEDFKETVAFLVIKMNPLVDFKSLVTYIRLTLLYSLDSD
jgi:hypothetical protein